MDQLIPVISKLQDVFAAVGGGRASIDLPQIVVVGSQSSGKSSVLENLVGRDFLPRGIGIVTRRPLVLQLFNTATPHSAGAASDSADEEPAVVKATAGDSDPSSDASGAWAEFKHLPGQRFTNFGLVKEEISRETERVVGRKRNISPEPIHLRIHAPDVVNLTLVDLPGITKVPVGDQPRDIEFRTREMTLEYISQPSSIILAIIEAPSDIANSEALKLAQRVDPKGLRTIGVVTKLDLMDAGTDAVDILTNRVIPLARGFVGVVNRSQKDINEALPMADARAAEEAFFHKHPAYREMAARMGSPYLARLLNGILMKTARERIPALKDRIEGMLSELQHELSTLGEPVSDHPSLVKGELLLMLLSKYATAFTSAVDGTSDSVLACNLRGELAGGARIAFVFKDVFAEGVNRIDPFDEGGLTDEQVITAIHNAGGTKPPLFVPQAAFELLVKRQIKRLEAPAMHCVDLVYDELVRMAEDCESPELRRFCVLRESVQEVVHNLLRKTLAPTHTMVSNLIHIELAHINTAHPDFIGGSEAVARLLQTLDSGSGRFATHGTPLDAGTTHLPADIASTLLGSSKASSESGGGYAPSEHQSAGEGGNSQDGRTAEEGVPGVVLAGAAATSADRMGCEITKSLIRSYFDIIRKNIVDIVPKTVMCFLVNCTKDNVRDELIRGLYRCQENYDALLKETDDADTRRKTCLEMQQLLNSALDILHEVREFVV